MAQKFQLTTLHKNFGKILEGLDLWAVNPWRRYSLFLIVFLMGFLFGSSVGAINGVLALMDPIGAFFIVFLIELMVRLRRRFPPDTGSKLILSIIDFMRMGLLYGLILEGFKLL